MKYLQADGIFRKSNKNSLTSNEAKVDRHQQQPYQSELIMIIIMQIVRLIMHLNSRITGAVICYPQQNIQIKHDYCAYKIHIFDQFCFKLETF